MPRGFFFDNTRCTGCRTCVLACKDYHDHGSELAFRMVLDYEGGGWTHTNDGTLYQDAYAYHISIACNHCNSPVCTQVCPTGAMHKDDLDLVWPDVRKCIGCGYCTMACPYHAPRIDQELKRSSKCDGCRTRVANEQAPICVEACPVRALDFAAAGTLAERYPTAVRSIMPLPPEDATDPNLLILPSPAAERATDGGGRIANRQEAGIA
ncbi:MAG: Anaerobic dimethyl sulfoxide reductase chain B [Paraeggerthella hongkongensis]